MDNYIRRLKQACEAHRRHGWIYDFRELTNIKNQVYRDSGGEFELSEEAIENLLCALKSMGYVL